MKLSTLEPARHANPTVKAQSLAYLMFERPDLDKAERFLTDFGLRVVHREAGAIYFRSAGSAPFCYRVAQAAKPRFVGFGLTVGDRADLLKLASLPGASPVRVARTPGGGEVVSLVDPSGFEVEVVAGQSMSTPLAVRPPLAMNLGNPPVRVDATQRLPVEPPEILKLGHVVLEVADFQATCGWYTRHLGLIPSDVQVLPDGSPAVAFMRLNLGPQPADHHTLALAQGFMPLYSHSAYEVVDADAVGMGQRLLRERGWRHAWGMGRHILGSQIFDYWQDPWGAKHEHYCDGDVMTAQLGTGVHPVSREAMSQWGPLMPSSFTKPKLTPSNIAALLRNLRRSPDLSVRKLITLARLFA
ncbi:2,4,5-trihydroxytoluene oxygenase [Aquabacterium sp.]|uniref:2,4,5-trihydroxytoluene oxygenase n=1 Tax=Aquabacterium sp. TaxID=1872578 RepID=UPI00248703FE|nr:2,4,5-trihydroxytoluene oxygenase [Aquabacterium sp.]MDI1258696.1 2,4,5-trihydroxytoluene oxygenase [Aquabacterium sp.]